MPLLVPESGHPTSLLGECGSQGAHAARPFAAQRLRPLFIEGAFDAEAIKSLVPMKRAGRPDEVADLVAFLHTLTDPRVANGIEPFDSPLLGSELGALRPRIFGVASPGTGGRAPQMLCQDPIFQKGDPGLLRRYVDHKFVGHKRLLLSRKSAFRIYSTFTILH